MKTQNRTYSHLSIEQRCIIRDMIYAGKSAREIAREIGVSPTTITREVKRNKIVKIPSIRKSNVSIYCLNFYKCSHKGDLCENCMSSYTLCQRCHVRKCTALCKDFRIKMCPKTLKWPYICDSNCTKRNTCRMPKCSYNGTKADNRYRKKLVDSRCGISISYDELIEMQAIIKPLLNKGQSPYVIFEKHKDELPVGVRSFYSYFSKGLLDITSLELPRKAR